MLSPPIWFEDEQALPVRELLQWFIRQLSLRAQADRQRPLIRKLNRTTISSLFDYTDLEEIDFLWEIIEELAKPPYEIWTLNKTSTKSKFRAENQISLVFSYSAESVVRIWLKMPIVDAQEMAWRDTVNTSSLTQLPLSQMLIAGYPGIYPPQQLLTSLLNLSQLINCLEGKPMTWRQLSAACFSGDSKYLDSLSRQQWILNLFPQLDQIIQPRRLLFDVYLVDNAVGILLVENQDTFCWLSTIGKHIACTAHLHLVFSRGFQISAPRARHQEYASFYFNGDHSQQEHFCRFWFSSDEESNLPFYFWGDLDFSGMGIIKSLRHSFSTLTAWTPGYAPMVEAISLGYGHSPIHAGKQLQLNPGATGCHYSDFYLLPLLEEKQLFLDQEWVTAKHLS
jgi:hypothetical protein